MSKVLTNPDTFYRSFGFCRYGKECIEAFYIIQEDRPSYLSLHAIKFYLVCRSIELTLKSFLLSLEKDENELKNEFGHDIQYLLKQSIAEGIERLHPIDNKNLESIKLVNTYYKTKQFEYIKEGMKRLPSLQELAGFSKSLNNAVSNHIVKLLKLKVGVETN